MRIEASDEVFVRARRQDVHPYLADVAGYGAWWPGCRSQPASGGAVLRLAPPRPRRRPARPRRGGRPTRIHVGVTKERRDLGVDLRLRGDLDGTAEWYYLDEVDGVVVHWLVDARAPRGGSGRMRDAHRAAVRTGMNALKDLLEGGRPPGAEPSATLLADQEEAIAAFRARVEAHRREVARRGARADRGSMDEAGGA